ncbi:MAG: YkgJ family cysteine cluster protein [Chloroflexi bacterium]|nr:YkgJ family cysteine cluster protein [Chloroflexota bacterium]
MSNIVFARIPKQRFKEFHASIEGEGWWWGLCADCGGRCEYNKIGSLLPGEKEFLAGELKMPVTTFADRYLDRLVTPFGVIDVLKLKDGCPFLDAEWRCAIKNTKVVLCETYPVAFYIKDERVEFFIDPWCPLTRHKDIRDYFEGTVVPALRKLEAPVAWYKAAALYDEHNFDYKTIEQERGKELRCRSFTLDYLMSRRV